MKLLVLMCFILIVAGICVWSCCVVCKENGFDLGLKRRLSMSFRKARRCILIMPLIMLTFLKSFGAVRRLSDQAET